MSGGNRIGRQRELPGGEPARLGIQSREGLRRLWSVAGTEGVRFGLPLLRLELLELDRRRRMLVAGKGV